MAAGCDAERAGSNVKGVLDRAWGTG